MKQHLDKAAQIHKNFRVQVDATKKDARHAVYVIQGNALTRAFAAFEHSSNGDRVSAMQQLRFLQECVAWVEYLAFEKDTARTLRAWFSGTGMTAPNLKKRTGLDEKASAWRHKNEKVLNNKLSVFLHPSRKSAVYAMDEKLDFDYSQAHTDRPALTPSELARMALPALLCLLISHPLFKIEEAEHLTLEAIWHAISDTRDSSGE